MVDEKPQEKPADVANSANLGSSNASIPSKPPALPGPTESPVPKADTTPPKNKPIVLVAVLIIALLAAILYFLFFHTVPLDPFKRLVMSIVASSFAALFLTGFLDSTGTLKGEWGKLSFAFTGAAAVFFVLLFWLTPKDEYEVVTYTIKHRDPSSTLTINDVVVAPSYHTRGVRSVLDPWEDGTYSLMVIFPPEVKESEITIKTPDAAEKYWIDRADRINNRIEITYPPTSTTPTPQGKKD